MKTSGWSDELRSSTYRTPVRRITAYRDQYVMGLRTMVPVRCYEFANGDILEGREKCQYVTEGDPFKKCNECGTELTQRSCPHYNRESVVRCERDAQYISRRYHHTLCAKHKMEEDNLTEEQLPR